MSLSVSSAGPWTAVHSGELEDSRQQQDPLPLQTFSVQGYARFVKFHITSFHGTYGGGLQYFNVLVGKLYIISNSDCLAFALHVKF